MNADTTTRLDEQALRRPDFAEGVPVVLADGQAWHLRRPVVRFVPADTDAGFEVRACLDDDGTFTRLVGELSEHRGYREALAAGKHLLLMNYAMTTAQAAGVLQFSDDEDTDPEGVRIFREVMAVVWGQGPKPLAGGDE